MHLMPQCNVPWPLAQKGLLSAYQRSNLFCRPSGATLESSRAVAGFTMRFTGQRPISCSSGGRYFPLKLALVVLLWAHTPFATGHLSLLCRRPKDYQQNQQNVAAQQVGQAIHA